MDAAIRKRVNEWLTGPYDEETKSAIKRADEAELIDAFYSDLAFGTAGLRGLMGFGTTRMNEYTVKMASQGLANYINKQKGTKRVFIGYDSRLFSREFAEFTAQVLAGNGIDALLLNEIRPVPFISFGTRYHKCTAGVMITASHNPKEYNGYKVYWSDGAQIVPPHDKGIIDEVRKVLGIEDVKVASFHSPHIQPIDEEMDEAYLKAIRPLQHYPEINKKEGMKLKIVYTSLHGTGIMLAPKALKDWGFESISYVEKQIEPDGNFPTVKFPNPEYKDSLALGIEQLKQTDSDILLANDPDADRIGVVVKHQNAYIPLTGNESAAILAEFICSTLKAQNKLPKNGALVTTIVTTALIKEIAKHYGLACVEVLTGFKYIGEQIHLWETSHEHQFIFGAEESYGCLAGTVARDKDAILATCLNAEAALHAKLHGHTLLDYLSNIYKKYGMHREKQHAVSFPPGEAGMAKMTDVMKEMRAHPPKKILNSPVILVEDYKMGIKNLPQSDVLLYRSEDGSQIIIRPSGTEPKIRLYVSTHAKGASAKELDAKIDQIIMGCQIV